MAKRRASGEGMLRKNKNRWEGRIVIGHEKDGSPIYHHITGKTQKEALAKIHQALDDYRNVELTEVSRITLNEWLERWLEDYVSPNIRESTLMGYRGLIRNHVAPHIGKIRIDKLTTHDIQQFYNLMKEEGRCQEHETKGYALASSTVRRMHGVLRQALETAAMLRMIPRNPMDNVQIPVLDYRTMQVYNEEELEIFKEAIKNEPEWYDFFYTEITTGLRQGELCGLMWSDFDEKAGTLTIRRTRLRTNDGKVRTGATKTDAGKRKILLPKSTAQLLRERSKKSYNEWIFYNPLRPEEPMDPHVAYRALKRIQESAGLPSIRFHDLRHTFATHALASGVDPKTLAGLLGHTNASFTLDTYAHVTSDMQKQAAVITEDFMTNILGKGLKPWQGKNGNTGQAV